MPIFSLPHFAASVFPARVASFHSNILAARQASSVSVVCIFPIGKYSLDLLLIMELIRTACTFSYSGNIFGIGEGSLAEIRKTL